MILNLIRAGRQGDQLQFRKSVEALAADERAKKHTIFADRILKHLYARNNGKYVSMSPSSPTSVASRLVTEIAPARCLDDLILSTAVEASVRELVEEQYRVDLLRSYGIEPRNRVLLAGPPGNGKTALAEAIASELALPLLVARYEAIVGSYLGETAQRIDKVFEYSRSRHCVLFFDEFDAIGKERGDLHETGEIKRVVSSLLLQIDSLPSHVVVVTASNHPELLDRAVWRRFQIRLELPRPKQGQVEEWFRRFEERTGLSLGISPRSLARRLAGVSFAEIEDFGNDILRRAVLAGPNPDMAKIVATRFENWKARFTLKGSHSVGAS